MQRGDKLSWTRTFTAEDVHAFGQLSGDRGSQHVLPDSEGRIIVQGLLTATLPTKLGGDIDFIARDMHFEFHRPVFTGDTIRCDVTIDSVTENARRVHLSCSWVCENQAGETVMTGTSAGIVRPKPEAGAQAA